MEDGAPTLARLIRTLGDGRSYPVIIHCAVGRDRTGIVVGLLLDLLGVPLPVIADDYALSSLAPINDGIVAIPDTMRLLLEGVAQDYGSAHGFLRHCGLTDRDLSQFIQAALTQPSPRVAT